MPPNRSVVAPGLSADVVQRCAGIPSPAPDGEGVGRHVRPLLPHDAGRAHPVLVLPAGDGGEDGGPIPADRGE